MKVLGAGGWGLAAVVMGLLAPPLARAQSADDTVRKQLAGEWTLVKYEVFPENGPARPGNYDVGRINYGERERSPHCEPIAPPRRRLSRLLRSVHHRRGPQDRRPPRRRIVAAHVDR